MALTLHGTVSDNTVALDRKTATPLIINGDMQIAQRGTSTTGITTSGYHTTDRMQLSVSNQGTWTVAQSTDAPDGTGLSKSYRLDCTTADASPAAGDLLLVTYGFEGQDVQLLEKGTSAAKKVTIAFYVKSNKTGTYILELDDNDNARNINQAYTISSANTWEKKVLSFDADTTGVLGNDNGLSLRFLWWLGSGSNFSSGSLQTSWASTTNANRAVGNVNLADSTDNDWSITGVQVEVGEFDANSIPPFQFEDRATSLARCQRYFQKLGGSAYTSIGTGILSNARTRVRSHVPYNTTMRSAPTLSIDGTLIVTERETFDTDISSIDGSVAGVNGAYINFAHSATGTALYGALITAKAGTTSFLEMDSEL